MASKRFAFVEPAYCVSCGCCVKVCPMSAIEIWKGIKAVVAPSRCVGCGKCVQECPAGTISLFDREAQA